MDNYSKEERGQGGETIFGNSLMKTPSKLNLGTDTVQCIELLHH